MTLALAAVHSEAMVLLLFIYRLLLLPLFVGVKCCFAVLCVFSSFAITLTRKTELVALLLFSFGCLVTVNVLQLFLTVPCKCPVGLPHGAVGLICSL